MDRPITIFDYIGRKWSNKLFVKLGLKYLIKEDISGVLTS